MEKIKLWFSILRPKTLLASIVPIIVGYMFFVKTGMNLDFAFLLFCLVFVCGVSLQTLSNLINDFYDYKKGTDKKGRIGFKRALAEGEVSIQQMKKAITINTLISLISGAMLIYVGGWVILLIGLLSILFAWLYSATSYSLSYLGIADIFAFSFYGPVATCGTFYLFTSSFSLSVFFAGCICGCVSVMILTVNNLRDIVEDEENNKKTFEVRFGKWAGETKYLCFALLTGVFAYLAFKFSIVCLLVVPAVYLFIALLKAEGKVYNKLLFQTSLLNLAYFLLLLVHFICFSTPFKFY